MRRPPKRKAGPCKHFFFWWFFLWVYFLMTRLSLFFWCRFSHFSMSIAQTVICPVCGFAKSWNELFWDLSLEHSNGGSVLNQLQHFMQDETGIEWSCPREGCPSKEARMSHKICATPRILMLQLKRFAMMNNELRLTFWCLMICVLKKKKKKIFF
jgi:ubiquitin C-terminal hydrolase